MGKRVGGGRRKLNRNLPREEKVSWVGSKKLNRNLPREEKVS